MRSAVGREASSIAACRAVASPSMPPTINRIHTMNTTAATSQPMSTAICHVVNSVETPAAAAPAASDSSTWVRAAPCELSTLPS